MPQSRRDVARLSGIGGESLVKLFLTDSRLAAALGAKAILGSVAKTMDGIACTALILLLLLQLRVPSFRLPISPFRRRPTISQVALSLETDGAAVVFEFFLVEPLLDSSTVTENMGGGGGGGVDARAKEPLRPVQESLRLVILSHRE